MRIGTTRVIVGISAALIGLALIPASTSFAAPTLAGFTRAITPCRVLDTRQASGIFAGALQPGELLSINTWGPNIILQGGSATNCPDIPNDAEGVLLNIIAVQATGAANNDLGIQPFASTQGSSTAINYQPGAFALNNGLFVGTCWGQFLVGAPLSSPCTQDITLLNGPGASAHVVIDITGFTRSF